MKKKKIEWMLAAGRNPYDKFGRLRFLKTSKCRECGTTLRWGDRRYNFDHKDNNPANNSQPNCYLVCRNCHGKHTIIKKRRMKNIFGDTVGYKTIKKKVGYKKPKKPKTRKKQSYRCRLPVDNRILYCDKKRADKSCLRQSITGGKCSDLIISRK